MNFKIISTGWNCGDVFKQTLASIEQQTDPNWQVHIVDDGSDPKHQELLREWYDPHDSRWGYTLNETNRGVIVSQYEGIRAMNPDDEDVIVFLDLDGDRFAHTEVLEHLDSYYNDPIFGNPLMTYGSYRPVPDPGGPVPISDYPENVIKTATYRQDTLDHGVRFNHLRTMKWKVLKQIPDSYYQWPDGTWLFCGSDYVVMMGCLEVSGGRYRRISETLMLYNAAQPSPDNVRHPNETNRCCIYALSMPPLPRGEFK